MKILSYDIESCTGSTIDASLCSFGYTLADENFNIIDKNDILVNPVPKSFRLGKWGEEPKIKLGYEESVFRKSPRFDKVYEEIKEKFQGEVVVIGFAITNDVSYLNNACEYYNKPKIYFKYFDVQKILGFFDNENKTLGLKSLGEKYNISFMEHRSDEDSYVTLMLVKMLCKKLEITFNNLMNYYEIMLGINDNQSSKKPLYLAEIFERKGLKQSKAMKNILFYEFLEDVKKTKKMNTLLSGKRFNFNQNLEYDNINYSRSLIKRIYELGGKYTSDLAVTTIYVKNSEENSDKKLSKLKLLIKDGLKVQIITEKELLDIIGEFINLDFDEVSYIVRHERIKELSRQKIDFVYKK